MQYIEGFCSWWQHQRNDNIETNTWCSVERAGEPKKKMIPPAQIHRITSCCYTGFFLPIKMKELLYHLLFTNYSNFEAFSIIAKSMTGFLPYKTSLRELTCVIFLTGGNTSVVVVTQKSRSQAEMMAIKGFITTIQSKWDYNCSPPFPITVKKVIKRSTSF